MKRLGTHKTGRKRARTPYRLDASDVAVRRIAAPSYSGSVFDFRDPSLPTAGAAAAVRDTQRSCAAGPSQGEYRVPDVAESRAGPVMRRAPSLAEADDVFDFCPQEAYSQHTGEASYQERGVARTQSTESTTSVEKQEEEERVLSAFYFPPDGSVECIVGTWDPQHSEAAAADAASTVEPSGFHVPDHVSETEEVEDVEEADDSGEEHDRAFGSRSSTLSTLKDPRSPWYVCSRRRRNDRFTIHKSPACPALRRSCGRIVRVPPGDIACSVYRKCKLCLARVGR